MEFTKRCFMTGKVTTRNLDITQEQFDNWQNGMVIQNAMPNLTLDEREFLITGLSKEGWDQLMKDAEND